MITTQQGSGYSADVRMQLSVNGHLLSIAQLGPDFVFLDDPIDHPPAEAEIAMSIDGREKRWKVRLPEGIAADRVVTKTADL